MAEKLTPQERSNRAQVARRQQMMNQGWSSDCAHAMHARCALETCKCKCHRSEPEPKRPELKTGAKAALPAPKMRMVKSQFSLALWGGDQLAAKVAPKYWTTPEDRLQDDERTALVNATYAELEARFPVALEWLAKAAESATEATLLYVIATIAAPRLARHGVISAELATAIVFAPIAFASASAAAETNGATPTVEPERTPMRGGPNGNGQIDADGIPTPLSEVQARAPEQAGPSDIPGVPLDQNRGGNGRHPL
jgi:hypothetical protein